MDDREGEGYPYLRCDVMMIYIYIYIYGISATVSYLISNSIYKYTLSI